MGSVWKVLTEKYNVITVVTSKHQEKLGEKNMNSGILSLEKNPLYPFWGSDY